MTIVFLKVACMNRKIYNQLIMKVVIFGAGRRGLRLARHLIEEKKAVTFLDANQERCTAAVQKLDCLAICGSATDIDKLKEAGCEDADAVIAVTDSDEVNLVSCGIVASTFPKVSKTIAAIRAISYLGKNGYDNKILGISHIVNPEQEAAVRVSGIIDSGLFSDIIYFSDAEFILFTVKVEEGDSFAGNNLISLKKNIPGQYVVTGVRRKDRVFTPSGSTVLKEGDEIAIICDDDETADIYKTFNGPVTSRLRRTIVIGATRLAHYLFSSLPKKRLKNVTLIEKDADLCKEFLDEFPQLLVLNGSITDEELWEEEKINKADLVISATDNDELNIIAASYAKRLGTKHSIAIIRTNPNYLEFAKHMDIDAAISPTEATVDALMKFMRGDGIKTLHSIFEGDLEVYEYVLSASFKELGNQLKDVKLQGKCIIAGVKRANNENFIPGGLYTFQEGDTVLVAAAHADYTFVQEFFS